MARKNWRHIYTLLCLSIKIKDSAVHHDEIIIQEAQKVI